MILNQIIPSITEQSEYDEFYSNHANQKVIMDMNFEEYRKVEKKRMEKPRKVSKRAFRAAVRLINELKPIKKISG